MTAKELEGQIIELRQQLSQGGDDVDSLLIIGDTIKAKKIELAKIIAVERQAKITQLTSDVLELVKPLLVNLLPQLHELDLEGFTCKHIGDTEDGVDFKLLGKGIAKVATIEFKTTKEMTGMALSEVFDKFANAEELAEFDSHTGEKNANSSQWRVKCKCRDRAIAEGLVNANAGIA